MKTNDSLENASVMQPRSTGRSFQNAKTKTPAKKLELFERYLSLWVLLCMGTGILGPSCFQSAACPFDPQCKAVRERSKFVTHENKGTIWRRVPPIALHH